MSRTWIVAIAALLLTVIGLGGLYMWQYRMRPVQVAEAPPAPASAAEPAPAGIGAGHPPPAGSRAGRLGGRAVGPPRGPRCATR